MQIGYARVSTTDQNPDLQEDALQKAGCEKIFRDVASGAVDSRKGLAEAIDYARDGDTLVVWKLDRLGRSLKQNKASGLNLVVAAIVLWNTVYLEQAVAALERQGTPVPADCLPHLSPLGWEHINLT